MRYQFTHALQLFAFHFLCSTLSFNHSYFFQFLSIEDIFCIKNHFVYFQPFIIFSKMAIQHRKYQERFICLICLFSICMTIRCLLHKYRHFYFNPSFFNRKIQKIESKYQQEYKYISMVLN